MDPHPVRLIAVAVAVVVTAGCRRLDDRAALQVDPCAAASPALLEVHAQDGVLQAALRKNPAGGAVLCDAQGKTVATYTATGAPPAPTLRNAAGDPIAAIVHHPGDDPSLVAGERALRLHDEKDLLRLIDPQGIPVGQIGRQGERAIAFDPGGRPLAIAEPAQPGEERRTIRNPDGSVKHLLLGLRDDRAAAAFALEALSLPERVVLARFLDAKAGAR